MVVPARAPRRSMSVAWPAHTSTEQLLARAYDDGGARGALSRRCGGRSKGGVGSFAGTCAWLGHEGTVHDGLDVRVLVRLHNGDGGPVVAYPRGLASMPRVQSRVGEHQPSGGPPLGARMAPPCQTWGNGDPSQGNVMPNPSQWN